MSVTMLPPVHDYNGCSKHDKDVVKDELRRIKSILIDEINQWRDVLAEGSSNVNSPGYINCELRMGVDMEIREILSEYINSIK